nr:hypothetical protein [Hydrogenophaga sp. PAMC20947]
MSFFSAWRRSSALARGLAVAALAAGGWALSAGASTAQARDVYWSVGVDSPGVSVGVSNAPPPRVVVHPRPVYIEQAPVVVYPGHRRPRPVYVEQAPVVYVGDYGYRDDRYYRHDRHNRWEERRRARHERRHDREDRRHGNRGNHRGHRDND